MKRLIIIPILFLTASWIRADDWPQFRGPNGSAYSPSKNLPVSWGEKENLRWRIDLPGRGLSSPVIAAGRIYVTACSGYKQVRLHVLCFDVKTGKELWSRDFIATGGTSCNPKTNMASCTPATDGESVFALFATGDLAALSKEGDLLWYRSLVGDYPKITNQVGMAASPVLADDVLLIPMENAGQSFVAGLDKKTGKNLWKRERRKDINWCTPAVTTRGGQVEALFQNRKRITAYDPKTGEKLWNHETSAASTPSPLVGEGMVFLSGRPYQAIRPHGDQGKPEEVWTSNRISTGYTTPFYHEGKIYALVSQGLRAFDAKSGEQLWHARAPGPFSASPVMADDKVYVVNEKGEVRVIRVGEEPTVVDEADLKDTILATPAIADDAIFFRSDKHLWCVSKR